MVRGFFVISAGLALTGCAAERHASNATDTDINAAAEAAQGDIDTYAANTLQAVVPARENRAAAKTIVKPSTANVPAAEPTPKRAGTEAADQPAALANAADASYRCAGETRVSARADDAPDDVRHAATSGRAAVWHKADGEDVRSDRDTSDRPKATGCSVN